MSLNREQHCAATTLDRCVLVAAGAGSGKTRMLTERIVNALVPGRVEGWEPVDISQVVAITFTAKAAGEITTRVRSALREAGEHRRPGRQDQRLSEGWISTIHSMCSRILRRYAFEAGVDPLFTVGDSVALGENRERAFEHVAAGALRRGGTPGDLFDRYDFDQVRNAVLSLVRECANRGVALEDVGVEAGESVDSLWAAAAMWFTTACDAFDGYSGSSAKPAAHEAYCRHARSELARLSDVVFDEATKLRELKRLVEEYPAASGLSGHFKLVQLEQKEMQSELLGRIAVAESEPALRALVEMGAEFEAECSRLNRESGVLDFDDLQVLAVELLETNEQVAKALRNSIRLVMIDEFQDTDMLQARLAAAISDSNLCTVGDEKQSIYSFRGADLDVYRAHRVNMSDGQTLEIELGTNYRSHPGILSFVNEVFGSGEYFGDGLLRLTPPEGEREGRPLDALLGELPRVEMTVVTAEDAKVGELRTRLAEEAADRIAALIGAGAQPSDCAILLRAYTNAPLYAAALGARGISATIVGGDRFWSLPEVVSTRMLVRAIANPLDDEAVAALLAGEFCPISDDSLARLRVADDGRDNRPLWDLLVERADGLDAADAACARRLVDVVERARERSANEGLSDVILQAVEEAGYDIRLIAKGNEGRDAMANVLKLARRAREFEIGQGGGAAEFERFLLRSRQYGDRQAPDALPDEHGETVRIMSIHASKGLEFPVAYVELNEPKGGSAGEAAPLLWVHGEGRGVRIAFRKPYGDGDKDVATPAAAALEDEYARREREECDRLLYVALTRARDLLLVGAAAKSKKGRLDSYHLPRLGAALGIDWLGLDEAGAEVRAGDARVRARTVIPDSEIEAADSRGRLIAPTLLPGLAPLSRGSDVAALPDRMSYTQLGELAVCPRRFKVERILGITNYEASDPRDPKNFGSAAHAVLQLAGGAHDLPDDGRIGSIARVYGLAEEDLERLRDAATVALSSPAVVRAMACDSVLREAPFGFRVLDSFELRGSIDLLGRSGTVGVIVDYKSGTSEGGPERYRLQAQCYALAALNAGCEDVEVSFVCPEQPQGDGTARTVTFTFGADDAERIESEIAAISEDAAAAGFPPNPGDVCATCPSLRAWCDRARR